MENLFFTAEVVLPVFLIVALGYLLRRLALIDETFVILTSRFVFSVSLPVLIFMELSSVDLHDAFNPKLITYVCAGTLLSFALSWIVSIPFTRDGRDRGVFIQGSFRGNFVIVGLALISNMFGSEGLGKASIIVGFILPLYNVLAIVALTVPLRDQKRLTLRDTLIEIMRNPLMLAVIISLPFSYFEISIGDTIRRSGSYVSSLALPLALIGIGGSLDFKELRKASRISLSSTMLKLIILPLIFTYGAYRYNFVGQNLAIIFILFASPTAIVSFVMADAMGCNSKLAGSIVLLTTSGSVLTMASGLFILKFYGLI
jgi:predicted permease